MGTWLLAIESLLLALLWVAMGMAWKARRPGLGRHLLLMVMIVVPPAAYGLLLAMYQAELPKVMRLPDLTSIHMMLLFGYVAGLIALRFWGRRRIDSDAEHLETGEFLPVAYGWSFPRFALATLGALILLIATLWILDLRVQHNLKEIRAKAVASMQTHAPAIRSDQENAALLYDEALALRPSFKQMTTWYDWHEKLSMGRREEVVQDPHLTTEFNAQAPMIALLHRAAEIPHCVFPYEYNDLRLDTPLPDPQNLLQVAYILAVQARVLSEREDLGGACATIQTLFRMAEHLAADPCLVVQGVAHVIEQLAGETLQSALDGRQPTTAELGSIQLETRDSIDQRLALALHMQKELGITTLVQLATDPLPMDEFLREEFRELENPFWQQPWMLFSYRLLIVERELENYRALWQNYDRLESFSFLAVKEQNKHLQSQLEEQPPGKLLEDFFSKLRISLSAKTYYQTLRILPRVAVAIHRYRADEGKLPERLADLVPKYLFVVPRDPYDNQPLRWKVTGDEWVVYSIGENLTDEEGVTQKFYAKYGDIGFFSTVPDLPPEYERQRKFRLLMQ